MCNPVGRPPLAVCTRGYFVALLVLGASVFLSCSPTIKSEPTDTDSPPAVDKASADPEGPPLLIVDMETPLLLDGTSEEEGTTVANTEAAVENTACFVCHANYMTESLASRHAGVNIGCIHCHGESTVHRNDENNTTPPEIMYPAEKIDLLCRGCHSTAHDIPPKTIITRYLKRSEEEAHRVEGVSPSNRGQDAQDTEGPSCTGCDKQDDVPPPKVVARWKERGLDKTETDPDKIVCTHCHGEHRMRVRTVIWDKKSGRLLRTNRGE